MTTGFGRYVLESKLGEGGLLEVFLASSPGVEGFSKGVLVKRLRAPLEARPELVARFVEAARRSILLSHAHLAQVLDLGTAIDEAGRERHFLVTEVVRGLDLESLVELAKSRSLELPIGVALRVAAEVARVLDHAHRRRDQGKPVVHAGLAPRSVFITDEGLVKVTDACIHQLALHADAPTELSDRWRPYRAPEELASGEISPAGDLWSLGALLHTLIALEPPREGSGERLLDAKPGLSRPAFDALTELLSTDPAARGGDAASWHERLLGLAYAAEGEREPRALVQRARAELAAPPPAAPGTPAPIEVVGRGREVTAIVARGVAARTGTAELERRGAFILPARADLGEVAALFGLVEPDGRDVEAAVDAALALLSTDASLSIGIDIGRVEVDPARPGEPSGGAALEQLRDRAERHADLPAGSLAVSRRVAALVRGTHLVAEGQHGQSRRTVVGQRPRASAFSRFQGRQTELRLLGAVFAEASEGKPSLVRLVGPPGVGKSRLVAEMARRLARSGQPAVVAIVNLARGSRAAPFEGAHAATAALLGFGSDWAELDALRRDEARVRLRALGLDGSEVDALLPSSTASGAEPVRIERAFASLVDRISRERPTMIVWDDARGLDRETARSLSALVEPSSGRRVMLVTSGREAPPLHAVENVVVHDLALGDLDDASTAKLLAAAVGARVLPPDVFGEITAITGGNPLLLEELVREMLDCAALVVEEGALRSRSEVRSSLPRTLRAVAEARLSRLGPEPAALVRAAAVMGADSSIETLAEVASVEAARSTEVLAEATSAGAIELVPGAFVGDADRYRVSALVSDVALLGLAPELLGPLYERALHVVERGALATPRALSTLAAHADDAGLHVQAAGLYARAAASAIDSGAYDLGAAAALRGVSLAASLEPRATLGLLEQLLVVAERTASLPELADDLPQALAAVDLSGDREAAARARVLAARSLAAIGATESARVLLAQVDAASDHGRDRMLAELAVASSSGDVGRALEVASELERSEPALDARAELCLADLLARADKLEAAFRALEAAARCTLDARDAALLAVLRGRLRSWAGDPRGALPLLERALELARADELPQERTLSLLELGKACLSAGEPVRALGVLATARDEAVQRGLARLEVLARGYVAHLEATVRATDVPLAELEAARARAEAAGFVDEALELGLLVAEHAARRGEHGPAVELESRAMRLGQARIASSARRLASRAR
jgi:eukaryotic-like serine/threonine-protein kinase